MTFFHWLFLIKCRNCQSRVQVPDVSLKPTKLPDYIPSFFLGKWKNIKLFLLPQLVQVWDSCWDASQLPSEESWEICRKVFRMNRSFQIVNSDLSISYPGFEPEIIDLSLFKNFFLQIYLLSVSVFDAYQLDLANVTQYEWHGREQKVRKKKSHSWKLKSVKLLIAVRISSLMEQVA